jgi:hypothetical protein
MRYLCINNDSGLKQTRRSSTGGDGSLVKYVKEQQVNHSETFHEDDGRQTRIIKKLEDLGKRVNHETLIIPIKDEMLEELEALQEKREGS